MPTTAERRQEAAERAAATKQFFDMFQTLLLTLQEKYIPRAEYTIEKQQQERAMTELAASVREVSGKFSELMEKLPEKFTPRREFDSAFTASVQDRQELRRMIGEVMRDVTQDERRDWGYKLDEQGKRHEGDERTERGWRQNAQQNSMQMLAWVIGGGFVLFTAAVSIILAVTRH